MADISRLKNVGENISEVGIEDSPENQLRKEYDAQGELFHAQAQLVQRFLESQARQAAEAVFQRLPQVRFTLPDRVAVGKTAEGKPALKPIPADQREQMAGGLIDRLTRTDIRAALRQRLVELEQSGNQAVATSASLLRYAIVMHMVHGMLPSGHTVTYAAVEGEEIPTIPVRDPDEPESAITAKTDAIALADEGQREAGRGDLLVPYVPAARRFYLPQWVAFDDEGHLLVNSTGEALAHLGSMQRFLEVLHMAVSMAPYIVADAEYQQKRYGMLGQLINQGRALAWFQTGEIIRTIQRRAAAQDLNRGLSLSLPFFDDQSLEMKTHDFEIIPAGRIMFVPAFVVRAAREEQAKVAQDTRLSPSTRKYLLSELHTLEQAFDRS